MRKTVINNLVEELVSEVMREVGDEGLLTLDPDSVDAAIQNSLDELETAAYDKFLENINSKLALQDHQIDKWW